MLLGSSGSVHAFTFKISPTSMEGQMETTPIRVLINSISRFIHLVSCQMMKPIPIQKDYRNMVRVLKLLKPVLDDVVDFNIDEILCKECEELDLIVNEAREFMENWSLKMSKICSVMRSEPLSMKIQSSSLEICRILHMQLQSSSSTSSLTGAQHCMKEIQCLKQENIMEHIDSAVRSQRDGFVPCPQHLGKIMEMLSLTSNKELLKETVAVEKERINIQASNSKEELDLIDQIVELVSNIREFMVKTMQFDITSGVPIHPYFRCPLSLELMLDPVIVASGQTYERSSIQKWLDHGLTICPKTRQVLVHTNLIPNFTVKAMIASWCEENSSRLLSNSENPSYVPVSSQPDYVSGQDLTPVNSARYSLHSSDSASRSLEIGTGFQKLKVDASPRFSEDESNGCQRRDGEKFDNPSPEQSYIHSRSESTASAISSFDYVPSPYKHEHTTDLSGEITHECPAPALASSKKDSGFSPWLSGKQFYGSKVRVGLTRNGSMNSTRSQSLPVSDLGSDDLITTSQVNKLVEDLGSSSNEIQTTAAAELRLLAKNNVENRIIIGHCGAIAPLLSLLYSEVKLTQEHAVTTLLNLSINEDNKAMIAEAGAIEPLIHVLKSGNDGAKENSAAALFSLSVLEEFKAKIGRSGAVKALVDLLGSGTLRGKKDAATALFNLSIFHENKARIVQAGAVKYLVKLMDPETGMVDKALALLANLATIGDGRLSIAREGAIPLVVEIVESGSQRGKENAASVLLQLCINNPKFCTLVLQEGAIPPLVALSQSGTPRAKEKAQQLLSHFRNLREGVTGKGKP